MRQRNDGGYSLLVAADPPFMVEPGQTVDHPDPITGLTELAEPAEDEPAGAEATLDPGPAKQPRRGRAHADNDTPGGQL